MPWEHPGGEPVMFSLVFTDGRGKAVNRNIFNRDAWKPALAAAGVIPQRQPGKRNWLAAPDDDLHVLRAHDAGCRRAGPGRHGRLLR